MAAFVKLATLDEIPPGQAKEVEHGGRVFALFNVGGTISALDGICPHQGGPLARGDVKGTVVACPWHGWRFDLLTGRSAVHASVVQPTFEVKVQGRDVLVAVP